MEVKLLVRVQIKLLFRSVKPFKNCFKKHQEVKKDTSPNHLHCLKKRILQFSIDVEPISKPIPLGTGTIPGFEILTKSNKA